MILITGAARRVGASISRMLHARGARVALHCHRSVDAAAALANELNAIRPRSAECFPANLLDTAALPALVAAVTERFARLDGVVNNASSFFPTPVGRIDEAAWDDLVGSNFKAPLFLMQAAAAALRATGGAIVNITDVHAERPLAGFPLYSAAKGALLTLTRAMAIELAPEVRVNAVAPGPILWPERDNPLVGQFIDDERRAIVDHTLLKREGSPDDIAHTVAFLMFDARYMTGQVLNVDGGRTAHL